MVSTLAFSQFQMLKVNYVDSRSVEIPKVTYPWVFRV